MQIFLNENNKMDFKDLATITSVKDYLKTLKNFLKDNPNNCFTCDDNCCTRDWNIELDIVFFNRLLNTGQLSENIINKNITINNLNRPVFQNSPCKFLNSENLCSIYQKRPFICRAYNCKPETESYKLIRDVVLDILNLSLILKIEQIRGVNKYTKFIKDLGMEIHNFPLNSSDYKEINIHNLINSSEKLLNDYRYKKCLSHFD